MKSRLLNKVTIPSETNDVSLTLAGRVTRPVLAGRNASYDERSILSCYLINYRSYLICYEYVTWDAQHVQGPLFHTM